MSDKPRVDAQVCAGASRLTLTRRICPGGTQALDSAGRVWWVVVDSRQPGYSEGIALPELTTLFLELGATQALNLDGGGSSIPVVEGQVMNSAIHTAIPGGERPVADHIGLRLKSQ